jgi:hypothetical protein
MAVRGDQVGEPVAERSPPARTTRMAVAVAVAGMIVTVCVCPVVVAVVVVVRPRPHRKRVRVEVRLSAVGVVVGLVGHGLVGHGLVCPSRSVAGAAACGWTHGCHPAIMCM